MGEIIFLLISGALLFILLKDGKLHKIFVPLEVVRAAEYMANRSGKKQVVVCDGKRFKICSEGNYCSSMIVAYVAEPAYSEVINEH